MQKPSKRLYTQLNSKSTKYHNLNIYSENDVWEDEDEMFDMSYRRQLFALTEFILPKGMKLENCFIDLHRRNDKIVVDLIHDGGINPDYEKEKEEYKAWTRSKLDEWEKIQDEDDIKNLESQIAKIKAKWK